MDTESVTLTFDLMLDEGYREFVYMDHLGHKTVGVGHLLVKGDPNQALPVGAKLDRATIYAYFLKDLAEAFETCEALFPDFVDLPFPMRRVLVNMAFNLGRPGLRGFKRMIAAVAARDWRQVRYQMLTSLWATQVGPRAQRLAAIVGTL